MTNPRFPFHTSLVLFAVILAACSPAVPPVSPSQPMGSIPSSTVPATVWETSTQPAPGPAETVLPTVFPIATSRGPNLEATDPNTVSLTSDGLQFVEFFEFW